MIGIAPVRRDAKEPHPKDFELFVERTEEAQRKHNPRGIDNRRLVYSALLDNDVGRKISEADRFERALAARGSDSLVVLSAGTIDDWSTVEATTWGTLAFEFGRAARILAGTHTQEEPAPALPLLHLCRHTLELNLKTLLDAGQRLAGGTPKVHKKHELMPLWHSALPMIKGAWEPSAWSARDADETRKIIEAFEKIDSSSMSTRYPVDTTGAAFPRVPALSSFSVKDMMLAFESATNFLATAHLWLEVRLRAREHAPTS